MIPRRKAHTYPGEFAEIARLIRRTNVNDTQITTKWEKCVADYIRIPFAAAVNSGRRAMTLILKHLNIGPGDEVIIPAYTLKDLVPLIQSMGARVIPADINPETLNICPDAIMQRITPQTKAIIALHAFGCPCQIERILALAESCRIPVIEDCAHSLGATVQKQQTGSFGYAAFLSFETTKPVNTFGGGMVLSRDNDLLETVRKQTTGDIYDIQPLLKKIRATKIERLLFSTGLAFPGLYLLATPSSKRIMSTLYRRVQQAPPADIRYSNVQAHLGLKKITTLTERIDARKSKASLLRSLLKSPIITQRIEEGCQSSWYFFVALLPCQVSKVRKKLLWHGIDVAVQGEIADDCASLLGYSDCPNVNSIYSRAIVLPLYEGISDRAIRRVARILNKAVS